MWSDHAGAVDRRIRRGDQGGEPLSAGAVSESVKARRARAPFVYRKVGSDSFLRELVVPFAGAGHVVLYRISAETGEEIGRRLGGASSA